MMETTDHGFTAPGHKTLRFLSTMSLFNGSVLLHHGNEKDCPWFYSTGAQGIAVPEHCVGSLYVGSPAPRQRKRLSVVLQHWNKALRFLSTASLFIVSVLLHHDDENTDHGFTAPGHRALWFLSTASARFSCTTTTKKTDCGFSIPGHKVLWLLSTVSLFSGLVLLHHDDEKD
jgi:hypothetical protein